MTVFEITFDEAILNDFENFRPETRQEIIDFFIPIVKDEFDGYPQCYMCIEEVVPYYVFEDQVLLFEVNYFDDGMEQRVKMDLIGFVHHNP